MTALGENRVCKCPVCGFEKAYQVGIGFMSDIRARMERGNILDGFYGPKAKAALVAYPEAAVGVEWALYQCRDCARLESRLAVKVSGPVRVPILQRCVIAGLLCAGSGPGKKCFARIAGSR